MTPRRGVNIIIVLCAEVPWKVAVNHSSPWADHSSHKEGVFTPLLLSSWIRDDFVFLFFTETYSRISERSFMGYQKSLFCCLGTQSSHCKDVWAVHTGGLQDVTWKVVTQVMAIIEAPNIQAPCKCQPWFFSHKSLYGDKDLCSKHSLSLSVDMQLSITLEALSGQDRLF